MPLSRLRRMSRAVVAIITIANLLNLSPIAASAGGPSAASAADRSTIAGSLMPMFDFDERRADRVIIDPASGEIVRSDGAD